MLLETASPDASLVVRAHGMHEEAVIAWWKLGRLELPRLCAEKWWRDVLIFTVVLDDVYSLHVNAWSFFNRSTDGSHDCPSSRNISWQWSDLICFNAPSFPRPANALTVSHTVYAGIPIRESQTPSPRPWRSLLMSMYLTRFFVLHFRNKGHYISGENTRQRTITSVSSGVTTTTL